MKTTVETAAAACVANAPGSLPVSATKSPDTLTVLFDGSCPLCRREIAHAKGLAEQCSDSALCFVDISAASESGSAFAADRDQLLARFHVQRADGSRLDGAAAFVAMWGRLPGWRWLARLGRLPGVLVVLEWAYRGFLKVRPGLQALAWRLEPEQAALTTQVPAAVKKAATPQALANVSPHLLRELRSDHAGETGAVQIYRGIHWVARWRQDAELQAFAQRHGAAEAEHLRLIEGWLPPAQRSRLLLPWRVAGWLTGALPALAGKRAVYATIAAVETFVDRHYQQQIDHLQVYGGPQGLLPLLVRCQAEEQHHRDEAAALATPPSGAGQPWALRLWCALVGSGSAAAVVLARRV